jgi:antibiotic biosynthesis monooxygenase (ABM) superfamily enzyme
MTVLTVAAVFAITLAFQLLVAPHVTSWPMAARLLVSAVVVVVLLGYVVMPVLSRLFRRWLHPSRD